MSRKECQIKVTGSVPVETLLSLGAELLGRVSQQDFYLAGEAGQTWRIREEAGAYYLAQKGHNVGARARMRDVADRAISPADAAKLMKSRPVRVTVAKTRTLYRLGATVVALDEVEQLGPFVELRAESEAMLDVVLGQLGLEGSSAILEDYLQLMAARKLPRLLELLTRFHSRIGELVFGITSGVLTTVGILVGVASATKGVMPIVAAIVAVAVSDSLSDAFSMYRSKTTERGANRAAALRHAVGTLAGKCFVPLTFIAPLVALRLQTAIVVCLVWGGLLLAVTAAEQAVVAEESVMAAVSRTLGLAVLIMLLSGGAGWGTSLLSQSLLSGSPGL